MYLLPRQCQMGIYVDDCLVVTPTEAETLMVYEDLKSEFEETNEGPIDAYLGVNITQNTDGSLLMTQPLLIQQILNELGYNKQTIGRNIPALSTSILNRDADGKTKSTKWDYQ